MRKILFILLLLPFVSQGQSTLPFSTIGVQNDDTAYTPNTLRFPKYQTGDTNKVFGINIRGIVELRTKGGTSSGLQDVITNDNELTKDDTINVGGNFLSFFDFSLIKMQNSFGDHVFEFDGAEGLIYAWDRTDTVAYNSGVRSTIQTYLAALPDDIENRDPNTDPAQAAGFHINGTGKADQFQSGAGGFNAVSSQSAGSVPILIRNTANGTGANAQFSLQSYLNGVQFNSAEVSLSAPLYNDGQGNPWSTGARYLTNISVPTFLWQKLGDLSVYTRGTATGSSPGLVFKLDSLGNAYLGQPQTYVSNKDTVLYQNWNGQLMKTRINKGDSTVIDNAGTLTVSTLVTTYVFTGTTSTWTMPPAANRGSRIVIINRGSGTITVNSNAGGNDLVDIYAGSLTTVNTVNITTTTKVEFFNDGVYWLMTP